MLKTTVHIGNSICAQLRGIIKPHRQAHAYAHAHRYTHAITRALAHALTNKHTHTKHIRTRTRNTSTRTQHTRTFSLLLAARRELHFELVVAHGGVRSAHGHRIQQNVFGHRLASQWTQLALVLLGMKGLAMDDRSELWMKEVSYFQLDRRVNNCCLIDVLDHLWTSHQWV